MGRMRKFQDGKVHGLQARTSYTSSGLQARHSGFCASRPGQYIPLIFGLNLSRPGSWDPEVPPGRRRRRSCCCRLAVRRGGERTNHHCDCEPSSHYHAIATSAVALAGLPNNLRARDGAGLVLLSMAADVSTPGGGAYGRRSQTHGMIVSPGLAAVRDQASSGIHEPSK